MGPEGGKGGVAWREPLPGNTGRDHGPCKPVNEMVLDSRTGEEETGNGAVLAEPCHRLRMDARTLVSGQFVNKFSWLDGVEGDELEVPSKSACARGVFSKE